ncbi:MAG: HD-GYP domain-containing protein [Nitrospirales bacterium]|nr:HD domain-containing protein [Nitrospirales bacterium]
MGNEDVDRTQHRRSKDDQYVAFVPIKSEVLRIGLYIKIEGSWFSHPFPTNSFKIKTTKELETLRGLTKVKLFFDPERSDPEEMWLAERAPLSHETPEIMNDSPPSTLPEASNAPEDDSSEPETSPDNPEDLPEDPIVRKVAQHEAFQIYQAHLQHVTQQFQAVVKEGKQMIQDAVSGRARGVRTAQKIIENLFEILGEQEQSRALLNLMGSDDANEEFFLHAFNVCSLSLMIANDLELKQEEKERLALGALFHDIGELKFPVEKLLRKGTMSPAELRTFLSAHPKYGVEIVEKLPNFHYDAVNIVRQHHERLNGSGFPSGKKDDQISKLAKIVMVADEYDELCHHPDPSRSMAPPDALSYLYVKCRHTLWQDAVVALIRQLGVYPPGSLVQLNNQKVGIVTSVNFEQRLRPIILVYDDQSSPDEPIVLNLAEEDDSLSIVTSIRPMDLSPKIRECLNPRKIISYFPSSSTLELNVENLAKAATSS